jgi:uncharacterized membrane protein
VQDDDRLERLERAVEDLTRRVDRLSDLYAGRAPREERPPEPEPVEWRPVAGVTRERLRRPEIDFEDLIGGRLLAWVGGSAIVVGIVFFLGMAISRGWIDEPTRTVLAFLGSSALLGAGLWLHESKGRTDASRAAVAAGIFGLYATLVVATSVYGLFSPEIGLACAALIGAVATGIAVRWESPIVGALGILGALLAPVLVDAGTSSSALAFMAIALCSAVGVLLWQRWNWLALGAFFVSAPQLGSWAYDNYQRHLALVLVVLLAFWALYVVAAIGYELRTRTPERLPYASWLLLLLAVLFTAGSGYAALYDTDHASGAIAWIVGLALGHIVLGAFALRQAINREIGSLLIAVGLVLASLAFADALGGPVLVAGWSVQAVLLAYLARRASAEPERYGSDAQRLTTAAAVYVGLAFGHVLLFEAPLDSLRHGVESLPRAAIALLLASAAAAVCARLLRDVRADWSAIGELLGAVGLVYLVSVAIVDTWGAYSDGRTRQGGQVGLSGYWTLLGVGALVAGLFRDERRLRLGGLLLLGLAVLKVFLYDLANLEQIYRVLSFIALGLLLLASAFAYQRVRGTLREGDEA